MSKLIYAHDGEEFEQEWGTCEGAITHVEAVEREYVIDYALLVYDDGAVESLR